MAAVSVSAPATPSSLSNCFISKPSAPATFCARPIVGLPALRKVQISCSAKSEKEVKNAVPTAAATGLVASALVAAQPALALVDERLSTEGTGLSLGVSNPLLVWILLGVATLVWALFFIYSSSLPEGDDDSGLAL